MNTRRYWLHRISNTQNISHPLLEKHDILSYGWSDIGKQESPAYFADGFQQRFEEFYGEKYEPWRQRWCLQRFLTEMSEGDYVLVPTWGAFHVYEIADNEPFAVCDFPEDVLSKLKDWDGKKVTRSEDHGVWVEGNGNDLGYFRRVKEIHRDISRAKFADARLTARLGWRGSNINCDNWKDSIEKAIQAFVENKPIDLRDLILQKNREHVLGTIRNELNPNKFEKLVKWYFQQLHANSVEIPAKNERDKEGDADVVAVFLALQITVYVQVKYHKGESGTHAVEQIVDYHEKENDEGHSVAWAISTADDFSNKAKEMAKRNNVRLIAGHEFAEMLLNVGFENLGDF